MQSILDFPLRVFFQIVVSIWDLKFKIPEIYIPIHYFPLNLPHFQYGRF